MVGWLGVCSRRYPLTIWIEGFYFGREHRFLSCRQVLAGVSHRQVHSLQVLKGETISISGILESNLSDPSDVRSPTISPRSEDWAFQISERLLEQSQGIGNCRRVCWLETGRGSLERQQGMVSSLPTVSLCDPSKLFPRGAIAGGATGRTCLFSQLVYRTPGQTTCFPLRFL